MRDSRFLRHLNASISILFLLFVFCSAKNRNMQKQTEVSKHDIWDSIGYGDLDMAKKEAMLSPKENFNDTMIYLMTLAYIAHKEGDHRGLELHFKCMDKSIAAEMEKRYEFK